MGWDADALKDGHYLMEESAAEILSDFRAASEEVIRLAGGVDGFLDDGGLDCSDCRRFIQMVLGVSAEGIWSPEEVQQRYAAANWPDPDTIPQQDLWAYWSARKFLDTCVLHHLGIEFDL